MIGHLDADCFYVSCERLRVPALRNQPVGVLGNQGACVIAKSYEMKARGVTTGVPIWDAVKLCNEGLLRKQHIGRLVRFNADDLDGVRPKQEPVHPVSNLRHFQCSRRAKT